MKNIEQLIKSHEGKTLEFKENTDSINKIVKTAIAFANTAGGQIVIGIADNKAITGISDPKTTEEKIANSFSDSIEPKMLYDVFHENYKGSNLIILKIAHHVAPFYLNSEGIPDGVYIRYGSTNRKAGKEIVQEIQLMARNKTYDEQPFIDSEIELDYEYIESLYQEKGLQLTKEKLISENVLCRYQSKILPTVGGALLFAKDHKKIFPDAFIRCGRFKGTTKSTILDDKEFSGYLIDVIEQVISFIERHTNQAVNIARTAHSIDPEYPVKAIREAIINAIVHTDYNISGSSISVAVFDKRIEITNPGCLPFGQTLDSAMSGVSQLRNKVIGAVFHRLNFVNRWGSGIGRILDECESSFLPLPLFKELANHFRITLFNDRNESNVKQYHESKVLRFIRENGKIVRQNVVDLCNLGNDQAYRLLKRMYDNNKISMQGSGKGAYYELLEE
jgi:ATP-dependent DNA helicase RecG